ncbi:hypothetical protein HK102_006872 [Quaeritorhiza haematococci]|nr:hypothetical protein HK102_006872 [Quaeritorhiza haematococci]
MDAKVSAFSVMTRIARAGVVNATSFQSFRAPLLKLLAVLCPKLGEVLPIARTRCGQPAFILLTDVHPVLQRLVQVLPSLAQCLPHQKLSLVNLARSNFYMRPNLHLMLLSHPSFTLYSRSRPDMSALSQLLRQGDAVVLGLQKSGNEAGDAFFGGKSTRSIYAQPFVHAVLSLLPENLQHHRLQCGSGRVKIRLSLLSIRFDTDNRVLNIVLRKQDHPHIPAVVVDCKGLGQNPRVESRDIRGLISSIEDTKQQPNIAQRGFERFLGVIDVEPNTPFWLEYAENEPLGSGMSLDELGGFRVVLRLKDLDSSLQLFNTSAVSDNTVVPSNGIGSVVASRLSNYMVSKVAHHFRMRQVIQGMKDRVPDLQIIVHTSVDTSDSRFELLVEFPHRVSIDDVRIWLLELGVDAAADGDDGKGWASLELVWKDPLHLSCSTGEDRSDPRDSVDDSCDELELISLSSSMVDEILAESDDSLSTTSWASALVGSVDSDQLFEDEHVWRAMSTPDNDEEE